MVLLGHIHYSLDGATAFSVFLIVYIKSESKKIVKILTRQKTYKYMQVWLINILKYTVQ